MSELAKGLHHQIQEKSEHVNTPSPWIEHDSDEEKELWDALKDGGASVPTQPDDVPVVGSEERILAQGQVPEWRVDPNNFRD